MIDHEVASLIERMRRALSMYANCTIGILGMTPVTLRILQSLKEMDCVDCLTGVYVSRSLHVRRSIPVKLNEQLRDDGPTIIVIASDKEKEVLLAEAAQYIKAETHLIIAGMAHLEFADSAFVSEVETALIPSMANGYEHSLIHIYQCLKNAERLKLKGIVAEFGMFKGGTTMFISRLIEKWGTEWKVYGFDTFAGFPSKRSPLDMFVPSTAAFFVEELAVRQIFEKRDVDIIKGDIVETASQLRGKPIVLAFLDTDNYSPATAVLDVIQDQVLPGGAIMFDHFVGRGLYTLGERMAAKRLLTDERYFNLHGTGVFMRQR